MATAALGAPAVARAQEPESPASAPEQTNTREPDVFDRKPGYAQVQATISFGDGIRFNNPYRLATPLGSDAESLSRTAAYVDLGFAGLIGDPLGLQHGAVLRMSVAVEGVRQQVLTPGYLLWRRWRAPAAFGRLGVPIVVSPQATWGLEAGAGGALFVRGGLGFVGELVGGLVYGAGTRDKAVVTYPIVSAQLGIIAALEVLP
jgi:hypothetical protein